MIVAYSPGDGAATNYEIAWVTVALSGRTDSKRAPDTAQVR